MDLSILKWVHATFHAKAVWLNYLMSGITWLGEFGIAAILLGAVLLIFKKTRFAGFAVAVAFVVDVLVVNVILKTAVNRPRPWTEWEEIVDFYSSVGVRRPTDTSFPSGHAAACFAGAVALTMRYKAKGIPALIVAALVAISRIYLCLHYPTDVLGGVLIGSACGVGGYYIARAIAKKYYNVKSAKIFAKTPAIMEEVFGPCGEGITPLQDGDATGFKCVYHDCEVVVTKYLNPQNRMYCMDITARVCPGSEPTPFWMLYAYYEDAPYNLRWDAGNLKEYLIHLKKYIEEDKVFYEAKGTAESGNLFYINGEVIRMSADGDDPDKNFKAFFGDNAQRLVTNKAKFS